MERGPSTTGYSEERFGLKKSYVWDMNVPWTAVITVRYLRTREKHSRRTLKDQGGIGTNENGAGTGTTSRASAPFSINGDVTGEDDSVATIPGRALYPVDSVENGSRRAVAGVNVVNALDVAIASLFE